MRNKVKEKLGDLSWLNVIEIILHPVLIPFTIIPAWAKSLWASRILLWGQWSRYQGFHAANAINSLFYRTQWININRYGRLANSPIVGLGNYPLSNWWHLSSLASYFYANAGAVTTLLGTIVLVCSHLIWVQSVDVVWLGIVTLALFLCSTMYAMAFARQNYQILAWMFLPAILFGLVNEQWTIATAALFFASALGITAFVVGSIFVVLAMFEHQQTQILCVFLPSIVAVTVKFIPLFIRGNAMESLLNIGKLIGLVHVKIRYKRTLMRYSTYNIYLIILYGLGLGIVWYAKGEAPLYLLAAYLLFVINQRYIRFADEESTMIVIALTAVAEVLLAPFNSMALLGLIVIGNPLLGVSRAVSCIYPNVFVPFDVERVLVPLGFFLNIPKKSKVLMAFADPKGVYENIFDGYRVMLEAPLLVASEKEIHLFPDWYAVVETNYDGAPSVWGVTVNEVCSNIDYWGAEYVVIYKESGTTLSAEWISRFKIISEIDWANVLHEDEIHTLIPKTLKPPKWWLLKPLKSSV